MESDDSLPVLTGLEFNFPILTPSTLGLPIEPIVNFFSPLQSLSRQTLLRPMNNWTRSQSHRDYLRFVQLLLLLLISCNLLPFLLLLETLDRRSNLSAKSEIDLNRNYLICNVLPTKTITVAIDSQLPGSTKESISLDSREL